MMIDRQGHLLCSDGLTVKLPENTFGRYMVIGLMNLIVFYLFYESLFLILENKKFGASLSWASAWILGSVFAHWTHRKWTFNTTLNAKRTMATAFAVYTIGLIGSTACFALAVEFLKINHRISWAVNCALWGVLDYLGLREIAFRHEKGHTNDL
jgi:putative flippase GtrA